MFDCYKRHKKTFRVIYFSFGLYVIDILFGKLPYLLLCNLENTQIYIS